MDDSKVFMMSLSIPLNVSMLVFVAWLSLKGCDSFELLVDPEEFRIWPLFSSSFSKSSGKKVDFKYLTKSVVFELWKFTWILVTEEFSIVSSWSKLGFAAFPLKI